MKRVKRVKRMKRTEVLKYGNTEMESKGNGEHRDRTSSVASVLFCLENV